MRVRILCKLQSDKAYAGHVQLVRSCFNLRYQQYIHQPIDIKSQMDSPQTHLQVISFTLFILAAGESVTKPSPTFPLAQLYFLIDRFTSFLKKSQKLCACISVNFWSAVRYSLQSSQFFSQQYCRLSCLLSTAKSGHPRMSVSLLCSRTYRSGYLMAMYLELRVEMMEQPRGDSLRVSVAQRMEPSPTVLMRKVTRKESLLGEGYLTRYQNSCQQYQSRFCRLICTSLHTPPSLTKSTSFRMEISPSVTTNMWQGVSPSLTSFYPGPSVLSSALAANLLNSSKLSLLKKGIFSSLVRIYSRSADSTACLARLTQMLWTLSSLTRFIAVSCVSPSSKLKTRRSRMASQMNCCSSIEYICFWILHFPRIITREYDSNTQRKLEVISVPGSYYTYSRGGTFFRGQMLKGQS